MLEPVAQRPILTIVTPTYNRLSYLQDCLHSVIREMEGLPVEVIVVDDASNDGSWHWLQTTEWKSGVHVRSVLLRENCGPGPARNVGLDMANGDYFCTLDSDMILMRGAKRTLENAIASNPDVPMLLFPCIEY